MYRPRIEGTLDEPYFCVKVSSWFLLISDLISMASYCAVTTVCRLAATVPEALLARRSVMTAVGGESHVPCTMIAPGAAGRRKPPPPSDPSQKKKAKSGKKKNLAQLRNGSSDRFLPVQYGV